MTRRIRRQDDGDFLPRIQRRCHDNDDGSLSREAAEFAEDGLGRGYDGWCAGKMENVLASLASLCSPYSRGFLIFNEPVACDLKRTGRASPALNEPDACGILRRTASLEHGAAAAAQRFGRPAAARKCFTAFCRKFRLRVRGARFVKAGGEAAAWPFRLSERR